MKTHIKTIAQILCVSGLFGPHAFAQLDSHSGDPASTLASDAVRATARKAKTVSHETTFSLSAPAEKVFPLLCPVREYDWLPNWKADILNTSSGYAEENCIFRTIVPLAEAQVPMIWICTRYEVPNLIEYTAIVMEGNVFRLKIALHPEGEGTRLTWSRAWISLGEKGDIWIQSVKQEELGAQTEWLRKEMQAYLETGKMLTTNKKQ